jgi:hypothetical protein
VLAAASTGTAAADAARWSPPAAVGACAATGAPHVVFPSDRPDHATGPGAIVWAASRRCPGGEGARLAAIGAGDVPGTAGVPRTASARGIALRGPLAVSGGPHGQILIAGGRPGQAAAQELIEGSARGPFAPLSTSETPAAPIALATAYLGDVALVAQADGALKLHLQRYFARAPTGGVPVSTAGAGAAHGLTVALDYRSDAITVWQQGRAIYARNLPASRTVHPTERLAAAAPHAQIAALISDDNRAIVAWSEDRAGVSSVYLDMSAAGVRFGAPRLLERFSDPDGLPSPSASPRLVRLSSESVMMAWAGSAAGRWVVRTAAIDFHGPGAVATIANAGDALLAGLAPGPAGEALVLWSEPQPTAQGPPSTHSQAIFAARGIDAYPGRTIFAVPELIAPPGPNSEATVAIDPESGRGLVAWRGESGAIDYSIRAPAAP